jgi:hypothetical protein
MRPLTSVPYRVRSAAPWLAAALLGAATFAAPLATFAQPGSMSHHASYALKRETLDQRIRNLHAELKITPAQEADWTKVADVMRHNEDVMQKMVADRKARGPHELNAVEDLKTYQDFNQAHIDGLKDLIASFTVLYTEMPDDQKLVADRVFSKYSHDRPMQHGAARSTS